jgi:hypothetical protein
MPPTAGLKTNLTPRTHTLTVESTGQKNADSTDTAVVVDAFDVTPGSAPTTVGTRIEETASPAAFTSGWTQGDTTKAWSAGAAAVSSTPAVPGARATFTFTGMSVNWIGSRGPQNGIARVYLDGAFQGTVDTYSPTPFQAVIYMVTKLAPATHTLAIEVTGQRKILFSAAGLTLGSHTLTIDVVGRNNEAPGTVGRVVVDAFDVY